MVFTWALTTYSLGYSDSMNNITYILAIRMYGVDEQFVYLSGEEFN